ncbi:o-succinylbenzoate synthase [Aureitalea marina]|uniref:o-succinylbenzoate synthase n=1 Tax=Aureitalea marina TaxID=930804 RepID=UPI0026D5EBD2
MQAEYKRYLLHFKQPGGTSRGVLHDKETWFLILRQGHEIGLGECGLFRGLSSDDRPDYEQQLAKTCDHINSPLEELLEMNKEFPSIRIGLEMAFRSLENSDSSQVYPSEFSMNGHPIPINGLVWMGDPDFMRKQIREKIDRGFDCVKLKIGALDFDTELELLKEVRRHYSYNEIMLRVDANGAFHPDEAMGKLEQLHKLDIHSIEQPIAAGQWKEMAELCKHTPLPIALDEELIGVHHLQDRKQLMEEIRPQYLILKPSLLGGFASCDQWIDLAGQYGAGWWVTSALESNIGLNAIAQYTFTKNSKLPQGLGTGACFTIIYRLL